MTSGTTMPMRRRGIMMANIVGMERKNTES